jgi:hypothetical protein
MDDVRKLPFCCGQDVEITIEGGCVGSIAAICIAFEDVTYKVEWFEGRSLRSEWFRSQQLAATSKVRTGTTIGFKTSAAKNQKPAVEIGRDGRCKCTCASVCPLGKVGMSYRCTKGDLEAAGIPTIVAMD